MNGIFQFQKTLNGLSIMNSGENASFASVTVSGDVTLSSTSSIAITGDTAQTGQVIKKTAMTVIQI